MAPSPYLRGKFEKQSSFCENYEHLRSPCNASVFPVFRRPFVKRFALCYRTVVCPVLSVCSVGILWPNGSTDPDETWHGVGLGPCHIVLHEDPAAPAKRGTAAPTFGIYGLRLCVRPYRPRPISIVTKQLNGSGYHLV